MATPPPREDEAAALHPLLATRYSPRAFLPDPVADDDLGALLEAARWAPSANNRQPWRFVVGRRGDAGHAAIARALMEKNRRWGAAAPVLLLAVAKMTREEGKPARHAPYDLGQAVAHLTIQAAALGYGVHQMAGFDSGTARVEIGVPEGFDPYAVLAVGRPGPASVLPEDLRAREEAPRRREPLDAIAFAGAWGEPLPLPAGSGWGGLAPAPEPTGS